MLWTSCCQGRPDHQKLTALLQGGHWGGISLLQVQSDGAQHPVHVTHPHTVPLQLGEALTSFCQGLCEVLSHGQLCTDAGMGRTSPSLMGPEGGTTSILMM